jgi:hypothetical protein
MAATTPVIAVREAGGTLREDTRAVAMIWRRELIRFSRNRTRLVTTPVQPLLFLLILGTGLGAITTRTDGVDFRTFMFPGVIAMSVLFTAGASPPWSSSAWWRSSASPCWPAACTSSPEPSSSRGKQAEDVSTTPSSISPAGATAGRSL